MRVLAQEWVDKNDLTKYAVEFRYPGELATKEEALTVVKAMRVVRAFVRQKLGITDQPV